MSTSSHSRRFKIGFAVFLGLVVLPVVLVSLLVFFLNTENGSAYAFAKLKGILHEDFKTDFQYGSARVDLLHGLHFKDLHVTVDRANLKAEMTADFLDLDYEFSILKRSLNIAHFLIGPTCVQVHKVLAQVDQLAPANPAADDSGGKKTDLGSTIRHPPIKVILEDFEIQNLNVDFVASAMPVNPKVHQAVVIKNLSLKTNFKMLPGQLQTVGGFSIASGSQIKIANISQATHSSGSSELSVDLDGTCRWGLAIEEKGGAWLYSLAVDNTKFNLTDLLSISTLNLAHTTLEVPKIVIESGLKLKAHSKELFAAEKDALESAASDFGVLIPLPLKLSQSSDGGKTDHRSTISKIEIGVKSQLSEQIQIGISSLVSGIESPSVTAKPMDLLFKSNAVVPRSLQSADAEGSATLNGIELLRFKTKNLFADADGKPADVASQGHIDLLASPRLADFLKAAASLRKTGEIKVATDFDCQKKQDGDLKLSSTSEINSNMYGKWSISNQLSGHRATNGDFKSEGKTKIIELIRPTHPALPMALNQVVTIDHRIEFSNGKKSIGLELLAPDLEMPGTAKMLGSKLKVQAVASSAKEPLDLQAAFSQERVDLVQSKGSSSPVKSIQGIDLKTKMKLSPDQRILNIENFELALNRSFLTVSLHGSGDIKNQDMHLESTTSMLVPPDFPEVAGQSLKGRLTMPIVLTVLGGEELTADGFLQLQGLSWRKGDIALTNINGIVPISEKLVRDPKGFKFKSLITENPFERVDFERVRPLLQSAEQLQIDKITWLEKNYGPMSGFFSIKQNMISAHQFDLDMGNGRMNGELFLNVYPSNLEFGLLTRLTGLDLGEILPQKFLARMGAGAKRVSGRTGVVINLNKSSVDGRVDVTEIGGPQLVALINVLDPSYQDEKMNKMRSVLTYGYPTSVALAFNQGYMDMDVGLSVLGVRQTESIRGIPVTELISSASADFVKQTQKGPLQ